MTTGLEGRHTPAASVAPVSCEPLADDSYSEVGGAAGVVVPNLYLPNITNF
jgi:hypothetical protein